MIDVSFCRWLYTAMTRASSRLYFISPPDFIFGKWTDDYWSHSKDMMRLKTPSRLSSIAVLSRRLSSIKVEWVERRWSRGDRIGRELNKKRESFEDICLQSSLDCKSGGYLLSHLRSTIGVIGLNCSVRDGKRWIPNAIATLIISFFPSYSWPFLYTGHQRGILRHIWQVQDREVEIAYSKKLPENLPAFVRPILSIHLAQVRCLFYKTEPIRILFTYTTS